MIQECLERSEMKGLKLHSLGWQTVAKCLEHEVNSIPLGFLQHQTDAGPLLRVLTPNSLKLNTSSNRSPAGLFTIPETPTKLMDDIEECYKLFYKVWNTDYIPLIAGRQKLHLEAENLRENDVVYFKLRESKISTKWVLGKVEFVVLSKDNKVRKVGVSYKQTNDDGEGEINVIERPARECVKLFNIEDSTLLDDMKAVREASKKILDEKNIVPESELNKMFDDQIVTIEDDENPEDDNENKTPDENNKESKSKQKQTPNKKKSETERLQIEGWKEPSGKRRSNSTSIIHPKSIENTIPALQLVTVGIAPQDPHRVHGPADDDRVSHDDDAGGGCDDCGLGGELDCGGVVDWDLFGTERDYDLDGNVPFYLL